MWGICSPPPHMMGWPAILRHCGTCTYGIIPGVPGWAHIGGPWFQKHSLVSWSFLLASAEFFCELTQDWTVRMKLTSSFWVTFTHVEHRTSLGPWDTCSPPVSLRFELCVGTHGLALACPCDGWRVTSILLHMSTAGLEAGILYPLSPPAGTCEVAPSPS